MDNEFNYFDFIGEMANSCQGSLLITFGQFHSHFLKRICKFHENCIYMILVKFVDFIFGSN